MSPDLHETFSEGKGALMLGCHDFCGYYEWIFRHTRKRFGQEAIHKLWREAIGGESQQHYTEAGEAKGLRGLYETWLKTGEDEHCDWTFTLDEEKNVLRWDMRECPSKGFLIENDLHADEDYCDHCMGWTIPLLANVGAEVIAHEHNHCGQCWGEISIRGKSHQTLQLDVDIRRDERWQRGFLDCWSENQKQPLAGFTTADPCEVLLAWFDGLDEVLVAGEAPKGGKSGSLLDAATFLGTESFTVPAGLLLGSDDQELRQVAQRFTSLLPHQRPLLMHAYLPREPKPHFETFGLPRPVPILPLLIRSNVYTHRPNAPSPSIAEFLRLIQRALQAGRPG